MGEAAALRPLASGKPHGEWFGLAGIAVMALPTLLSLGRQTWSTEAGAHGPIVLATGIWLFWRCWPEWVGAAQPGEWKSTRLNSRHTCASRLASFACKKK